MRTRATIAIALCSVGVWIRQTSGVEGDVTPKIYHVEPTYEDERAFRELRRIVKGTKELRRLSYDKTCGACDATLLTLSDIPRPSQTKRTTEQQDEAIRELLGSRQSFVFGVQKSCFGPFAPSKGIEFIGHHGNAVLLIMPGCQWARLVEARPLALYLFNITDSKMRALEELLNR